MLPRYTYSPKRQATALLLRNSKRRDSTHPFFSSKLGEYEFSAAKLQLSITTRCSVIEKIAAKISIYLKIGHIFQKVFNYNKHYTFLISKKMIFSLSLLFIFSV